MFYGIPIFMTESSRQEQPTTPEKTSWPSLEKTVSFIILLASLIYGLGLLAANCTFGVIWKFNDFNLSHQRCVIAGVWFLIFALFAYLCGSGFHWVISRFKADSLYRKFIKAVLIVPSVLAGVAIMCFLIGFPWPGRETYKQDISLVLLTTFAAGSFLSGFLLRKLSNLLTTETSVIWRLAIGALTVMASFGLLVCFAPFYVRMPVATGGGRPQKPSSS